MGNSFGISRNSARFSGVLLLSVFVLTLLGLSPIFNIDAAWAQSGKQEKPELFIPCLLSQPFLLAMNEFEKDHPDDIVFLRIRKMGELTEMLANPDAGATVFLGDLELANLIRDGKLKYRDLAYVFFMDTPLALIVREGLETSIDKASDLVNPQVDRMMFPSPEIHSLGDRIKEILVKEGVYDRVAGKVAFIPPDKMILQYITSDGDGKGAKASIVYSDCILSNSSSGTMPRGIKVVKKWSPGFFTPIPVYTVHENRAHSSVAAFLKFIRTPRVAEIFAKAGYGVNAQGGEQGKLLSLLPPPGTDDCPDCPVRSNAADGAVQGKIADYPEGPDGECVVPKGFEAYFDARGKPLFPIIVGKGKVVAVGVETPPASKTSEDSTVAVVGLMPPTDCKNDLLTGLIGLALENPAINLRLLDMFSKEARGISASLELKCSAILIEGSYTWKVADSSDEIRDIMLKGAPGSFGLEDVRLALGSAMAARGIPVALGQVRPHDDYSATRQGDDTETESALPPAPARIHGIEGRGSPVMDRTVDSHGKAVGASVPPEPVVLRLPFSQDWTVVFKGDGQPGQGGGNHFQGRGQEFGLDFLVRDEAGRSFRGSGKALEDYLAYGMDVLAPGDGVVTDVIDGVRDNAPGVTNPAFALGNTVVIRHADDQYSVLSHLMKGSILVVPGQRVSPGDPIALCGNSGDTAEPRLHYHLQSGPFVSGARGYDALFSDILIISDGMAVAKEFPYSPLSGQVLRQWE